MTKNKKLFNKEKVKGLRLDIGGKPYKINPNTFPEFDVPPESTKLGKGIIWALAFVGCCVIIFSVRH